jgi:hypothetical protein
LDVIVMLPEDRCKGTAQGGDVSGARLVDDTGGGDELVVPGVERPRRSTAAGDLVQERIPLSEHARVA